MARSLETPRHLLSGEYSHKHADKGPFYFILCLVCVHIHMCIFLNAFSRICVHVCFSVCVCVHMCVFTCVCGYDVPHGDQRTALVSLAWCHLLLGCIQASLLSVTVHQTSWPQASKNSPVSASHLTTGELGIQTCASPCLALQVLGLQTEVSVLTLQSVEPPAQPRTLERVISAWQHSLASLYNPIERLSLPPLQRPGN